MAVPALLLLLASVCAGAAAEQVDVVPVGTKTTWLRDVLVPSLPDNGADQQRACLQFLRGTACKCQSYDAGFVQGFNCRSQLQMQDFGCCPEVPWLEGGDATVGSCTYNVQYTIPGSNVIIKPGVEVIATASFTCELTAAADKCGSPLNGGMSITGFGKVYALYNNAYTVGYQPYVGVSEPNGCGKAILREARNTSAAEVQEADDGEVAAYRRRPHRRGPPDEGLAGKEFYPTDSVEVFLGSFFVASPRHTPAVPTGQLQFAQPFYNGDPPVTTLPPGATLFKPWAMDLRFSAAGGAY